MPSRPSPKSMLGRAAWLVVLGGLAASGEVSAQPPGPLIQVVPAEAPPPKTGAVEQAPPATVAAPEPVAVPPISEKEVSAAPPPNQPKPPPAPVRRTRYDVAVIEALDKVTAESLRFEAAVGRPVRYKSLVFTVKACERSTPDEPVNDSIAYLTVDSQPRAAPGRPALAPRQAFKGWMYASSPGLHPLEHPVYDAWLITCRAAAPPSAPAR